MKIHMPDEFESCIDFGAPCGYIHVPRNYKQMNEVEFLTIQKNLLEKKISDAILEFITVSGVKANQIDFYIDRIDGYNPDTGKEEAKKYVCKVKLTI